MQLKIILLALLFFQSDAVQTIPVAPMEAQRLLILDKEIELKTAELKAAQWQFEAVKAQVMARLHISPDDYDLSITPTGLVFMRKAKP